MTGIDVHVVQARAQLRCDKCGALWRSQTYNPNRWGQEREKAAPAFEQGWRVYVGGRAHRTYCEKHGPTVPMRLLYGTETATVDHGNGSTT